MTVVGIIPARAGSRRLPGKNLAPLDGLPLIAHTCRAARDSGILDALFVNTDSPEIAAVAARFDVPAPFLRPVALARDDTPTRAANRFFLDQLAARGQRFDAVMVLQPTSPLRGPDHVRAAWALYETHAPCAVVSVSPAAPATWLGRLRRDGAFEPLPGPDTIHRLNGAIYIYDAHDYRLEREPPRTLGYVMPADDGLDIDSPEDLARAEFILRNHRFAHPAT